MGEGRFAAGHEHAAPGHPRYTGRRLTGEAPKSGPGSQGVPVEEAAVEAVSVEEDPEAELDKGPVTVGDLMDGTVDAATFLATSAKRLVDRGRYRKLRISRKGKPLLPDIPLAAVAAVEAASLYGAGFARVLAVNIGARFLFDLEVVNEADRFFKTGVERFLEGDLERAEPAFLRAVTIDDTHAAAYLQLGVLYRMQGDVKKARPLLERAMSLDPTGELGRKAGDVLRALGESR